MIYPLHVDLDYFNANAIDMLENSLNFGFELRLQQKLVRIN